MRTKLPMRCGRPGIWGCWLLLLVPVCAPAAVLTRGPYLQMGNDSAMTLRWRSDVATNSRVRVGTDPANLHLVFDGADLTREHVVRVTGLGAATRYYYSVGSSTQVLLGDGTTYFETAPAPGTRQPIRVWVIGDAGTGTSGQKAVYNAYRTFTGSTYTDLFVQLGDNAYNDGTDAEYQAKMFNVYGPLLRQSPTWPTLGNHDGHTAASSTQTGPYYDIFTLPKSAQSGGMASGTEAYYSYDYGNVHFIVLDSYETSRAVGSPMLTWLEADLQATDKDWIVAYWHHPPYSKGSHNSDSEAELVQMRQNVLPLLENYGVDLVLGGHSHAYERSKFIDGHYGVSSTFNATQHVVQAGSGRVGESGAYRKPPDGAAHAGAVYTVAGSSGQTSGGALNHPAMHLSLNVLGSVVLDIDGLTLDAKFLDSAGNVRDSFRVAKDGAPPPPPPPTGTTVSFRNGVNGYAGNTDTYVASKSTGTNYGTATTVKVDGDEGTRGRLVGLLKWTLPGIAAGKTVTGASVTLQVADPSPGVYNLRGMNVAWTEGGATWANTNPSANQGVVIGTFVPSANGSVTVPLNAAGVALVQGWVDGARNKGILVIDGGTTNGVDLRSSEYGTVSQRPRLTVTYQ
ncbi:MAG TPA: DNRLRE domain-containing protein [Nevskiaceae bacterium]|nr:DNRLRE domain-containing protein [Nevskiaceae bacterium]